MKARRADANHRSQARDLRFDDELAERIDVLGIVVIKVAERAAEDDRIRIEIPSRFGDLRQMNCQCLGLRTSRRTFCAMLLQASDDTFRSNRSFDSVVSPQSFCASGERSDS
jgi:hypothetical protein